MVAIQNINLTPNEPSLKDLLNYFEKSIKLNLNCHHIGKIITFNSTFQTAQATINYVKTFQQIDSIGNASITTESYPQLIDCPVICLGGGLGSLTFPITPGDECLILFNDRDLDNWFGGSSSSPPATPRTHAFSDAVILVGLRSMPNVITNYDGSSVSLNLGLNSIKIQTAKIIASLSTGVTLELDATGKLKITNLTGEFVASLVTLFTDIQNGLVTTMLGPEPLVMPTFATDLAVLQTFKA